MDEERRDGATERVRNVQREGGERGGVIVGNGGKDGWIEGRMEVQME